jgi:protein disulfide-isomerase
LPLWTVPAYLPPRSPSCPHCIDFAPTYQTLYELYYTSHPSGSGNEDADFTKFYDFRFASLNCAAYGDLCVAHGVGSYPTTILYKDGEVAETFKGAKKLPVLHAGIESVLEKEKPGTRPTNMKLPQPGDTSSPEPDPVESAVADASKTAKVAPDVTYAAAHRAASKEPRPAVTPNPNGQSVPLSAETFQTLVTMTQEPWFIKFYAPWCHHCQAMAPSWDQLAKRMEGRLNIGEVNCDAESRLCKDVRLKGYPTILFFKGGERVEYDGLRGLGDFVHYAEKAIDISGGIQDVDAASFSALEEKEDVIFVYFYDHATTSEDFTALERLPLSLIGRAKLVKTRDPKLYERFKITTWPRLLAAREGRPTYYTPLTPKAMRDIRQVLNWMKSVWLPIVPELTASNAREVMDGKLVVLGILNRDDHDSFQSAKREMKSAANEWMDKQIQLFQLERKELRDAKQLRIDEAEDRGDTRALRAAKSIRINMDKSERKQVAFAWVDGVFWQRWIRSTYGIDVKDGERVVINDEDVSSTLHSAVGCCPLLLTQVRTDATGTKQLPETTSSPRGHRSLRPSTKSPLRPRRSSLSSLYPASRRSSSTCASPSWSIRTSPWAASSDSASAAPPGSEAGSGETVGTSCWTTPRA